MSFKFLVVVCCLLLSATAEARIHKRRHRQQQHDRNIYDPTPNDISKTFVASPAKDGSENVLLVNKEKVDQLVGLKVEFDLGKVTVPWQTITNVVAGYQRGIEAVGVALNTVQQALQDLQEGKILTGALWLNIKLNFKTRDNEEVMKALGTLETGLATLKREMLKNARFADKTSHNFAQKIAVCFGGLENAGAYVCRGSPGSDNWIYSDLTKQKTINYWTSTSVHESTHKYLSTEDTAPMQKWKDQCAWSWLETHIELGGHKDGKTVLPDLVAPLSFFKEKNSILAKDVGPITVSPWMTLTRAEALNNAWSWENFVECIPNDYGLKTSFFVPKAAGTHKFTSGEKAVTYFEWYQDFPSPSDSAEYVKLMVAQKKK